jgi:RNA polymerase sigma-B factor
VSVLSAPLLHLDLEAEFDAPQRARRALEETLAKLRSLDRADLLVLISELVGAGARESGAPITLDIWRTNTGLRVRVRGIGAGRHVDPLAREMLEQLTASWFAGDAVAGFDVHVSSLLDGSESDAELFARWSAGDRRAREELVERYRGFAQTLTRRFVRAAVVQNDLDQAAVVGLLKAIDRFDPERAVQFTTFATRTIDGELKRQLRDRGWSLKVPRGLQELGHHATQEASRLTQVLGREPTLLELADAMGHTASDVGDALLARRSFEAVSLDASTEPESGTLIDALPDEDARLMFASEWMDLTLALRALPVRERHIVELRFFEDLSQAEIARRVGMSQMHVSRLLSRSLNALRTMIASEAEPIEEGVP